MKQSSTASKSRKGRSGSSTAKRSSSRAQNSRSQASSSRSSSRSGSGARSGETSSRSNQKSTSLSSSGARGNQPAAAQRSSGQQTELSGGYLEKFFMDQVKDIYYAEQKLVQALNEMKDAATTDELKEAFEDHMHQTERHARRLEKVFQSLGQRPEGKVCEAIEGIIREVHTIIDETEEGTMTRDAALIIAGQKVEHYEIATYGGLVTLAITMGMYDAADLLDRTLIEEEQTDYLLTDIAENYINIVAEDEGNEGYEEEEEEEEGEEEMEGEEEGQGEEEEEEEEHPVNQ